MNPVVKVAVKVFAPLSFRAAIGLMFFLPAVISLVVFANEWATSDQFVLPLLGTGVACLLLCVASLRAAAFMSVSDTVVSVGFSPLWVTRIARGDVQESSIVTIDAYKDYNGWGIKGSAKRETGRLYSAGGTQAVRIRDARGRVFLLAVPSESEHARMLARILVPPNFVS